MDARVIRPLLLSAWATTAAAQEAPFGLAWGPVTDVPRPSMVDQEANVTALTYLHDKPIASGADTDRVILEVCRDEGLQQVVWLSRPLSAAELPARYDAILREGTRRNGPPRSDTHSETVAWPRGRTLLAVGKPGPGGSRLVMLSRGERYDACSRAHASTTGHPANGHAGRLINGEDGDPRWRLILAGPRHLGMNVPLSMPGLEVRTPWNGPGSMAVPRGRWIGPGPDPGYQQPTRKPPMRKSLLAVAALAALGAIGIAAPASAAPGMVGALDATTNVVDVRMDGMHGHRGHGRMMGHRHGHRHMMRHHHHRGHMMRHGHGHRHHRM